MEDKLRGQVAAHLYAQIWPLRWEGQSEQEQQRWLDRADDLLALIRPQIGAEEQNRLRDAILYQEKIGGTWHWIGDGEDYPQSLTCPIFITAGKLREVQAEARQKGRKEVVDYANKFLELAEHGDYSNGVEAWGSDEGRVKAGQLLAEYRKAWQDQKQKWGIKPEAKK